MQTLFEQRQENVIEHGDAVAIINFAMRHPDSDIQALQDAVMKKGCAYQVRRFAEVVPTADIKAIQQHIIDNGTAFDAYMFAKKTPGADIDILQAFIIQQKDGFAARLLANIPGTDQEALRQVVSEHGTVHDIWVFRFEESIRSHLDSSNPEKPRVRTPKP